MMRILGLYLTGAIGGAGLLILFATLGLSGFLWLLLGICVLVVVLAPMQARWAAKERQRKAAEKVRREQAIDDLAALIDELDQPEPAHDLTLTITAPEGHSISARPDDKDLGAIWITVTPDAEPTLETDRRPNPAGWR